MALESHVGTQGPHPMAPVHSGEEEEGPALCSCYATSQGVAAGAGCPPVDKGEPGWPGRVWLGWRYGTCRWVLAGEHNVTRRH